MDKLVKVTIYNVYYCNGKLSDCPQNNDLKVDDPDAYKSTEKFAKKIMKLGPLERRQIRELELKYDYNVWLWLEWVRITARRYDDPKTGESTYEYENYKI